MNGTVEQAEVGGSPLSDAGKKAKVEQWRASGKSVEEFAEESGVSKWSLMKWKSQFFGRGHKAMREVWAERAAKVKEVDRLRESGLSAKAALLQLGIMPSDYGAWRRHAAHPKKQIGGGRPKKIRLIRELPFEKPSENGEFNKSVMAENQALRKLVVDLSLDVMALKDAMGKGR